MIDEIARVRHQHISCKTAVNGDAEMMMCGAHVLFAGAASRAGAAANPGIHRDLSSDLGTIGVFPGRFNDAGDLVPKRERQSAVFADIEAFLAAEREIAVLHMQIRMAHAAAGDADKNLGAVRHRTIGNRFA